MEAEETMETEIFHIVAILGQMGGRAVILGQIKGQMGGRAAILGHLGGQAGLLLGGQVGPTAGIVGAQITDPVVGPQVIDQVGPQITDPVGLQIIDPVGPLITDPVGPQIIDPVGPHLTIDPVGLIIDPV